MPLGLWLKAEFGSSPHGRVRVRDEREEAKISVRGGGEALGRDMKGNEKRMNDGDKYKHIERKCSSKTVD